MTDTESGVRCYQIVRSWHPFLNKTNRVIKKNLTLKESQDHCSDPSTREKGVWFDGYEYMPGCEPDEN